MLLVASFNRDVSFEFDLCKSWDSATFMRQWLKSLGPSLALGLRHLVLTSDQMAEPRSCGSAPRSQLGRSSLEVSTNISTMCVPTDY